MIKLAASFLFLLLSNPNLTFALSDLFEEGNQYVKAEIVTDRETLPNHAGATNKSPRIGVLFSIKPGWHIYWQNSGDSGSPTQVKWILPENYLASSIRYPAPYKFEEHGEIVTFGYSKKLLLISDLQLPEQASEQLFLKLKAQVNFLACKRVCLPGRYNLEKRIAFSQLETEQASKYSREFDHFDKSVPIKPTSQIRSIQSTLKSAIPGSNFHLIINLDSSQFSINPSTEDLQVFPYKVTGGKIGRAYLANSISSEVLKIVIPVTIDPSVSSTEQLFSGTLVISQKVTNRNHDVAYEWSFAQKLDRAVQNSDTVEFVNDHANTLRPLSYRIHQSNISPLPLIPMPLASSSPFSNLFFALLAGFIAGIILNVMPCVLPILSIKVIGFIHRAQQTKAERTKSALFYMLGTISAFVALALVVVILKQIGTEIGWGFQFQHPSFILALVILIFIFSLSLFDVYELKAWGATQLLTITERSRSAYVHDFGEGILAAVLATPCSAPLLGTALAFAFTSSSLIIIAVFMAIGVGLAFPFVVLSLNEKLLSYLPKPGAWMVYLKHFLGLILLGTCLWLIFILSALTVDSLNWVLLLIFIIASSFMSYRLIAKTQRFKLLKPLIVIYTLVSIILIWPNATKEKIQVSPVASGGVIEWQAYSEKLLNDVNKNNQPAFIVFTADWCLTCKFNEKFIINSDEIAEVIKQKNIVPIKADWTTGAEPITKALKSFGGNWVPYYVAIPSTNIPTQTPGPLLTKAQLKKILMDL